MRRSVLLLIILGFIVITLLWWFLLISPRNAAIDDAQLELEAAKAEEITLQAAISQLRAVEDNELSFIFALGEMESSIPIDPELDAFIEDLTFLADTTGIEVSTLSTAVPSLADSSALYTVTVAISFEGEYFEVLGFLYGLEDLERLVVVDSLALTPVAAIEEEATETAEDEEGEDEVEEPRARPDTSTLSVSLSARLFTRSTVTVPAVVDTGDTGDSGDEGDGS